MEDPTLAEGTPKQIHLDLMTRVEKKSLKWFYGWKKYPHRLVLNVPKSDDEDVLRVNRLVCYFDKAERIDFKKLVVKNIDKNIFHLVSFENECIFSVMTTGAATSFSRTRKNMRNILKNSTNTCCLTT